MFRLTRAWMLAVGLVVTSVTMAAGAGAVEATPDGGGPTGVESSAGAAVIDGEYIVQLEPSASGENSVQSDNATDLHSRVESIMNELARGNAGTDDVNAVNDSVMGELSIIDGFGARLSAASAERLAQMPGVAGVYPNTIETVDAPLENPPWGLDRIDQKSLPLDRKFTPSNDGSGVHIYIVDQAIFAGHVEFSRGLGDGVDLDGGPTEGFCARHGTHVAGTAAGADVGVAKAATLHSVRVFNCDGSSPTFRVLQGLDWIASHAKRPAVVNMSLGGRGAAVLKTAAVNRLAALGITTVASAGNYAEDACDYSPASAPRAITVAASDERDVSANFSNFGTCVDLYAPGVRITSASSANPDTYVAYNGTSMSAPHVAGAVATYLHAHPDATPAQVHQAIVAGAVPNQLTSVPAKTPNRLLNVQALPEPGDVGPGFDGPVAYIASFDARELKFGSRAVFDGSGSIDPGGSALSYAWTIDDSSEVVGTNPKLDYWLLQRGVHNVNLTVTNAEGKSDTLSFPFLVVASEDLPAIDANLYPAFEFSIAPGREVTFDATGSWVPFVGELAYLYRVYRFDPTDGTTVLVATGEGPKFSYTFPTEGEDYDVQVTVISEYGDVAEASTTVNVTTEPTTNASISGQTDRNTKIPVGTTKTFDGSLSGYQLLSPAFENRTFEWTLFDGERLGTDPTLTHTFNQIGPETVYLNVNAKNADGTQVPEMSASVSFDVVEAAPPTVVLTPSNQVTAKAGEPVLFSGVGSEDPDGGPISLTWTTSDAPGVVASTDMVFGRVFDAPGQYEVMLGVTDDEGNTVSKSTTVTVMSLPVAEFTPGTDQYVFVGQALNFDGSASKDPDGGALQYEWRSTGLSGVVSKQRKWARTFKNPGRYGVELTVIDDEGQSAKKHINVWVTEPKPPVAEFTPGTDQRVDVGAALSFDGARSNDPDGGALTYEWRSTGVPGVAATTSKYSREFTKPGRYGVELTVIDDEGESAKKHINVWVIDPKPPVAAFTPGTDQRVGVGTKLSFDGSRSNDPDGGAVTFVWRSTGVSGAASKTSKYSREFTKPGKYGVELIVTDDEGQSTKKRIEVFVVELKPPVAEFSPGTDQRVTVGAKLNFDGSASKDPDGGLLRYEWRSTGVSGLASKTSKYSRTFTKPGRYGVELTVIDDEGQRTKKHINVWVSES